MTSFPHYTKPSPRVGQRSRHHSTWNCPNSGTGQRQTPTKWSLCLSQPHGKSGVCEWHSGGIWNPDEVRAIQAQWKRCAKGIFGMAHGTWDGTGHDEGRVQDFDRPCVIVFINLAMTSLPNISFDIREEGGWPPHGTMANHESLIPDKLLSSGRSCSGLTPWKQTVGIKTWST